MALGLYITNRCNLNCRYCFNWAGGGFQEGADLPLEKAQQVLDVARQEGHRHLTITGGEPFVHPDIFAVIDYAHNQGYLINILTNGLLLDDESVARLRDKYRLRVRISLDGASQAMHEYFRGPGTFGRTMETLARLVEAEIPVGIGFTVYSENLHEVDDVFHLARRTGCAFIRFSPVVRIRKGKAAQKDADLHAKVLERIVGLQLQHRDELELPGVGRSDLAVPIETLLSKGCEAGRSFFAINPEGMILPCPLIRSAPDVFRKEFTGKEDFAEVGRHMNELWAGPSGQHQGACANCNTKDSCGGGCPAEKLSYDLTLADAQPVCYRKMLEGLDEEFGAKSLAFLKQSWVYRLIDHPQDQARCCWRQAPFWSVTFKRARDRRDAAPPRTVSQASSA